MDRNAKDELTWLINDKTLKAAFIQLEGGRLVKNGHSGYYKSYQSYPIAELKVGHNSTQLDEFLKKLDFEYDAGYGSQELYGTVWFTDGSLAARCEYDGSEWWELRSCPEIPEELK